MKRVLLTGAAGGVGSRLRRLLKPVYPELRLSDINTPADLASDEPFVRADLAVLDQVEAAVDGVEGIIHLGGFSVEGPWETILQANIVGCYNLFEAARRKGVKRVVFASSNHAVGFYPRARRIGSDVTVRPDSRYGASKAFGEALGALYADKHGLGVLCLRIGNVAEAPADRRRLSIWVSPEDLAQLVRIGLEHPDLRYEVFYGASRTSGPGGTTRAPMPTATVRPAARRTTATRRWRLRLGGHPIRWATSSRVARSAPRSSTAGATTSGRWVSPGEGRGRPNKTHQASSCWVFARPAPNLRRVPGHSGLIATLRNLITPAPCCSVR